MTTSSSELVAHLKVCNLFVGVDVKYYMSVINDIENGTLQEATSSLENAKIKRVNDVLTNIKSGRRTKFTPLKFNCEHCNSEVKYYSRKHEYSCSSCKAKVTAHADMMPKGTLVSKRFAKIRVQLHQELDEIWQSGAMTRNEVYRKLSRKISYKSKAAHIGSVSTADDVALFYHAILQLKAEHLA
jgi:competence CoiA-like predicted nuclease